VRRAHVLRIRGNPVVQRGRMNFDRRFLLLRLWIVASSLAACRSTGTEPNAEASEVDASETECVTRTSSPTSADSPGKRRGKGVFSSRGFVPPMDPHQMGWGDSPYPQFAPLGDERSRELRIWWIEDLGGDNRLVRLSERDDGVLTGQYFVWRFKRVLPSHALSGVLSTSNGAGSVRHAPARDPAENETGGRAANQDSRIAVEQCAHPMETALLTACEVDMDAGNWSDMRRQVEDLTATDPVGDPRAIYRDVNGQLTLVETVHPRELFIEILDLGTERTVHYQRWDVEDMEHELARGVRDAVLALGELP
jgi:hypothetical protein